jgi:Membrane-associated phospholipid phosphatase
MRSTPSGHSSISFAGFLYLTLWLCGQYKLFTKTHPLYKYLVSCSPLLLATYVALSRTQDYRHHFMDIFMGGCIGIFFAIVVYNRYFESIWSEEAGSPVDEEVESILPS